MDLRLNKEDTRRSSSLKKKKSHGLSYSSDAHTIQKLIANEKYFLQETEGVKVSEMQISHLYHHY